MEDDNSEHPEPETFNVELNASLLYSLNTILNYNMVEMQDPTYSNASHAIARKVNEVMASEEFDDALEKQIDRMRDLEEQEYNDGGYGADDDPMPGVQ